MSPRTKTHKQAASQINDTVEDAAQQHQQQQLQATHSTTKSNNAYAEALNCQLGQKWDVSRYNQCSNSNTAVKQKLDRTPASRIEHRQKRPKNSATNRKVANQATPGSTTGHNESNRSDATLQAKCHE